MAFPPRVSTKKMSLTPDELPLTPSGSSQETRATRYSYLEGALGALPSLSVWTEYMSNIPAP